MTANDTHARETVANAVMAAILPDPDGKLHRFELERVVDRILDPEVFARLAGLLGYAKTDGEEWGYRTYPGYAINPVPSRGHAELGAETTTEGTVERRSVGHGPWEVVSDAAE